MDTSAIKHVGLLPSLVISSFLFAATVSVKVNAEPINMQAGKAIQLAHGGGDEWNGGGWHGGRWHGGGWHGHGYGYGTGWYGPGYNSWGGSYIGCQKRCFVNRWNRLVCATRCY